MTKKELTPETREQAIKAIAEAIKEAHENALLGIAMNVFVDTRDWDAWATAGSVTDDYMAREIYRVEHVEPYSLDELFGDDPNLEADPDEFENWYLTEDSEQALCQTAQAEEWLERYEADRV